MYKDFEKDDGRKDCKVIRSGWCLDFDQNMVWKYNNEYLNFLKCTTGITL